MKRDRHPPYEEDGCLSYREIGARLGMSHANVILIERRAIKKLREGLIAAGFELDAAS